MCIRPETYSDIRTTQTTQQIVNPNLSPAHKTEKSAPTSSIQLLSAETVVGAKMMKIYINFLHTRNQFKAYHLWVPEIAV